MNWLLTLDGTVFHAVNKSLQNPLFDLVMPLITELGSWGAVWLFLLFLLAVLGDGEGRKMAFLGTVALVVSWLMSDLVLKELFARPRPFVHFNDARLLVSGPHQYSFPSGHTATAFATAAALLRKSRRFGLPAMLLALLIGFSRVYVGVHYPLDVAGGALLGLGVGWLTVSFEPGLDKLMIRSKKLLGRLQRKTP